MEPLRTTMKRTPSQRSQFLAHGLPGGSGWERGRGVRHIDIIGSGERAAAWRASLRGHSRSDGMMKGKPGRLRLCLDSSSV